MKSIKLIIKLIVLVCILTGEVDIFQFIIPIAFVVYIIDSIQGSPRKGNSEDSWMNARMKEEQNRLFEEQSRQFMEESLKSVTPWEHGGYDMNQGNSWNQGPF